MNGWLVAAVWLAMSVLGALAIGRAIGLAPDPDVWGCDECEREAVELSMSRHPSSRTTCPDFVPEEWSA